jgi:hypothetical protein
MKGGKAKGAFHQAVKESYLTHLVECAFAFSNPTSIP